MTFADWKHGVKKGVFFYTGDISHLSSPADSKEGGKKEKDYICESYLRGLFNEGTITQYQMALS